MSKVTAKRILPFLVLAAVAIIAIFVPSLASTVPDSKYNSADVAWMLVATALVFLMTPGLAFFYGGMVNRKNVLSTMMKSVVAAGVVGVLWIVVGYSLCFGESIHGIIGNPLTHLFYKGVWNGAPWGPAPTIPKALFSMFQLMFAIITPGLVVGAIAERMRFSAYVLFTVLFSLLVYAPLAHWSWHPDGFLAKMGALDFAGGTVVHISAGCAALAGALVLKRRKGPYRQDRNASCEYPLCIDRYGAVVVWLVWLQCRFGQCGELPGGVCFSTTNTAAASAGSVVDVLRRAAG